MQLAISGPRKVESEYVLLSCSTFGHCVYISAASRVLQHQHITATATHTSIIYYCASISNSTNIQDPSSSMDGCSNTKEEDGINGVSSSGQGSGTGTQGSGTSTTGSMDAIGGGSGQGTVPRCKSMPCPLLGRLWLLAELRPERRRCFVSPRADFLESD
jgi:hypothetical protein